MSRINSIPTQILTLFLKATWICSCILQFIAEAAQACKDIEYYDDSIMDCQPCRTYCSIDSDYFNIKSCEKLCFKVFANLSGATTTSITSKETISTAPIRSTSSVTSGPVSADNSTQVLTIMMMKPDNLAAVLPSVFVPLFVIGVVVLIGVLLYRRMTQQRGATSRTPSVRSESGYDGSVTAMVDIEQHPRTEQPADQSRLTIEAELEPARSPERSRCVMDDNQIEGRRGTGRTIS